jgi:hypothetical protein
MKRVDISRFIEAYRSFGCEPPSGYVWAAEHGLIGFEEFTEAEPWFFCDIPEILPLHRRWPNFKEKFEYLPFARMQGHDDIACFKMEQSRIIAITIIHYNLGNKVWWELRKEYKDFWDWMRGIISDIERWCNIKASKK